MKFLLTAIGYDYLIVNHTIEANYPSLYSCLQLTSTQILWGRLLTRPIKFKEAVAVIQAQ
jgi:hypothetical protein